MKAGRWGANHTLAAIGMVVATIGLPGTLWAVDQFTNAAIIDPVSGKKARVTNTRALVVTGTVSANPASLLSAYRGGATASHGGCAVIAQPAAQKALLIKTIDLAGYELSASNHHVQLSIGNVCGANLLQQARFNTADNKNLSFEPGIVVPAGQKLWALAQNLSTTVVTTGFQLPAAALPGPGGG